VPEDSEVARTARDVFGWEQLRPGQQEAMEALVAGRDVLAVLPTGAGKSAIYQVPGLLRRGPTIVVSPLVALQHDQHAAVERVGDGAVQVNAAVPTAERAAALHAARRADAEFVFVTPEQLADPEVLRTLRAGRPSLIAVDEAHCVSAWGHDFRPDYRQLGRAIEALGHPPVAALTATAAPPVRDDIVAALGLRDPLVIVQGLDRPNIELDVRAFADAEARRLAVIEHVFALPLPGIVYVGTRREARELADALGGDTGPRGTRVAGYHAGLAGARRRAVHEAFLGGELDVVVATSAFGMGIDKPDIRFVLHATTPDSPDAYLQELGRAGRDGEPAWALLLHHPADLALRRFLSGGLPGEDRIAMVARAVGEHPGASRAELLVATGLGRQSLGRALLLLEQVGAVRRDARGRPHGLGLDPDAAGRAGREQAERHQQVVRSRIALMRDYVSTGRCRRQFLLGAMGERLQAPCGSCDTCRAGATEVPAVAAAVAAAGPLAVAGRVTHPRWGAGVVMDLAAQTVTVLFDAVGYRTLALDVVQAKGLLEPA
jgi:ATP-dependent DNA helicase RecQ